MIPKDHPDFEAVCKASTEALSLLHHEWGLAHTGEGRVRTPPPSLRSPHRSPAPLTPLSEVIVPPDAPPRLIEVNGRAHNADFLGVCTACIGYNAFQVMADAYFGGCENERSEGDPGSDDDDAAQSDDAVTWEGTPRRPEVRMLVYWKYEDVQQDTV